jgi:hypothetical protein
VECVPGIDERLDAVSGSPTTVTSKSKGKGRGQEESPPCHAEVPLHKKKSIPRRQSMPSIAIPPPYSVPQRKFPSPSNARVKPRDEEGHEQLPGYSNEILLIAQITRKMVYTQPGVMSKDRKRKHVWCVLEGTKLGVYGMRGMKSAWEGVVGAEDMTVDRLDKEAKAKAKDTKQQQQQLGKERKVAEENRSTMEEMRSPLSRQSLEPSPSTSSPLLLSRSGSPPLPRYPSSGNTLRSGGGGGGEDAQNQQTHTLSIRTRLHRSGSASSSTKSEQDGTEASRLAREYTLQNVESRLASDYTKRRNVIRVRMEGEQFLLQVKDVDDVVAWIEMRRRFEN